MNLFDLHCDTAGECFNKKISLYDGNLNINLCKGESLDKWAQFFAIWIPDNLRGAQAEKYFNDVLLNFINEIDLNGDKIKLCKGIEDFEICKNSSLCAGLLACEGASPFADSEGVSRAKALGVKLITLTWNGENEIGYGCQSGCDYGLKPEGKQFIKAMEKEKIIADVSHLNRRGFYDVISSGVRVIASHSNSKNVLMSTRKDSEDKFFSCRRNLDDEQVKLLIECNGLVGLNFCKSFLGDEGDDGIEAVYRHAEHILNLGGENILAIGSDFDGCDINNDLDGINKISALYEYFLEKGFSQALADKIFFENADKFFKTILQS